ncbi:MBL fold metallo-hydrolase [Gammaproteobacteria bacterium]|nr:MBL fold metallo-hydrolase [Gammaproteobacteria bacterium]
MKLLKYIFIIGLVGFILVSVLTRVPAVQDRLMLRFVQTLGGSTADLNDNSLSAVVCGSRSPIPSPGRAQACVLVNAGGNYYVVDIGDGSANNLNNWRIDINKIRGTLLTHLHSDHISDLADLHLATWVNSAHTKTLDVYGPEGVELVTQGFENAYQLDYQFRHEHHGDEVAPRDIAGFNAFPVDLSNPVIIDQDGLKVTAFRVPHDPVKPALGYRFDYKGRSIVISGDTSYSENLIKHSQDADVLFHEAQANHQLKIMRKALANNKGLVKILNDIETYHTTPIEAAQAANLANVDHLIFYHLTPAPRNNLTERMFFRGVDEIRKDWSSSKDGTMVVLPLDSDEIIITEIN